MADKENDIIGWKNVDILQSSKICGTTDICYSSDADCVSLKHMEEKVGK